MRKVPLVAAVLGAFVLGAVMVATASRPRVIEPTRIHVIERALSDRLIDLGKPGDTSGDLLTFHNPLYDAQNKVRVGHDQGECIRISPHQGTWECRWIAWLEGGSITVEGPFFDSGPSKLAITGGTGMYSNARGSMQLKAASATAFHFVYNVRP